MTSNNNNTVSANVGNPLIIPQHPEISFVNKIIDDTWRRYGTTRDFICCDVGDGLLNPISLIDRIFKTTQYGSHSHMILNVVENSTAMIAKCRSNIDKYVGNSFYGSRTYHQEKLVNLVKADKLNIRQSTTIIISVISADFILEEIIELSKKAKKITVTAIVAINDPILRKSFPKRDVIFTFNASDVGDDNVSAQILKMTAIKGFIAYSVEWDPLTNTTTTSNNITHYYTPGGFAWLIEKWWVWKNYREITVVDKRYIIAKLHKDTTNSRNFCIFIGGALGRMPIDEQFELLGELYKVHSLQTRNAHSVENFEFISH